MKTLLFILMLSTTNIALFAQKNLDGKWHTGNQNTIVEIQKNNDIFEGKIYSSDNPNAKLGSLILKDIKWEKGKYEGKIFAPERGEWYQAQLTPEGHKLNISIKVGFFSKTVEWVSIDY